MSAKPNLPPLIAAGICLAAAPICSSFVPAAPSHRSQPPLPCLGLFRSRPGPDEAAAAAAPAGPAGYDQPIADCLSVLNAAAFLRTKEPGEVAAAMEELEGLMQRRCRAEPMASATMLANLNGSWRLVFTTQPEDEKEEAEGAKRTANYWGNVQTFDTTTDPCRIENGFYLGNLPLARATGPFVFDFESRRLEFDFTDVEVFGNGLGLRFDMPQRYRSTGLGSETVTNGSWRGELPFLTWISADETIATARAGGGGLALWKRIAED